MAVKRLRSFTFAVIYFFLFYIHRERCGRVYRIIYLLCFKTIFYLCEYIFLIFLNSLRKKKTFIKYKFKNLWNSDLKRLTITTTVTKLLRFTWVMFNVTRMVFLHTSSVLPKQSCLKCVYPPLSLSHQIFTSVWLVMWSSRKLFSLSLSRSLFGTSHPLGSALSIRVMCVANFIFSKKEKTPPHTISPWAIPTLAKPPTLIVFW